MYICTFIVYFIEQIMDRIGLAQGSYNYTHFAQQMTSLDQIIANTSCIIRKEKPVVQLVTFWNIIFKVLSILCVS